MVRILGLLLALSTTAWAADPILTVNPGATAYQANQPAVALDSAALVSDSDNPSNFDGGSLTITLLSIKDSDDAPLAPDPGDTLLVMEGLTYPPASNPIRISITGSIIYACPVISGVDSTKVPIAVWTGGSGGADLVLSLTRDCTTTNAIALLRTIAFRNMRGSLAVIGKRTIGVLFQDGTAAGPASGTTKVQVVALPAPPTASAISLSSLEDTAVSGTLVGSDPQGGAITYVLSGQPEYGSAQLINSATGQITYTPPANWAGSTTVAYTVTNGVMTSDPAIVSITITAVNDRPTFRPGGNQSAQGDGLQRIVPGWATSISAGGGTDESNQTVSFVVSVNPGSLFTVAPALLSDGTLTYTPAPGASGAATITVTAVDTGGTANGGLNSSTAVSASITVTSIDLPPIVSSVTMATVVGSTVVATPTALASSSVTWSLQTACSLGTLTMNPTTGELVLAPSRAGTETIAATATSAGGTTVFPIPLSVQSNDQAGRPRIDSAPRTEWVQAGQTWTYDLTASASVGAILDARVTGVSGATVTKMSGNSFIISVPAALNTTLLDIGIVVWDTKTLAADGQRILVRVVTAVGGNG